MTLSNGGVGTGRHQKRRYTVNTVEPVVFRLSRSGSQGRTRAPWTRGGVARFFPLVAKSLIVGPAAACLSRSRPFWLKFGVTGLFLFALFILLMNPKAVIIT